MFPGDAKSGDKQGDVLISNPWELPQELDIATKGGFVDPLTPASGLPSNSGFAVSLICCSIRYSREPYGQFAQAQ
jgi:hypothetical protein